MKVAGHIPVAFKGRTAQAFVPYFDMVAHAEEYSKQIDGYPVQEARRFARMAKKNGTWLTPTLTTMEWIASQAKSLDGVSDLRHKKHWPRQHAYPQPGW